MVVSLALSALAAFVAPIGIYQVLKSVIRLSISIGAFEMLTPLQLSRDRRDKLGYQALALDCVVARRPSCRVHVFTLVHVH